MCAMYHKKQYQQGSLLPIAAFILIALGVLAGSLLRLRAQAEISLPLEVISSAAFYSAESGAQWSMGFLFYPEVNRSTTDSRCVNTVNGQVINYAAPGLNSCRATLSCVVSVDPLNTTSFYLVNSRGRCDVNGVIAERSIELSAMLRDAS